MLPMPDDEIRKRYRDMKPTQDRAQILADLNGCHKRDILAVLGEQAKQKSKEKPEGGYFKVKLDKQKAKELYDKGMYDKEIADECGVSAGAICQWRKASGLKALGSTAKKIPEGKRPTINQVRKAAVVNPEFDKAIDEMIARLPKIEEPDPWKIIEAMERERLVLIGIAIGAGVRDVEQVLKEALG